MAPTVYQRKLPGRQAPTGVLDTVRTDARQARAKMSRNIVDRGRQGWHILVGNTQRREAGTTSKWVPDEALLQQDTSEPIPEGLTDGRK